MGLVSLPSFGSDPATVTAPLLDGKVDPLATEFNGNIENANIKAGAAISYSKLSLTDSILAADINSSAAIPATKLDLSPVAQTIQMSAATVDFAKGTDLASASTVTIGAALGNAVDITGTTTITAFDSIQAGVIRHVRFTGALTLTHNATSLILPGAANITTAANDTAGFESLGSGNWLCIYYQKASGSPISSSSGNIIQTVNTQTGASASGTTTLPIDDTIPQNTEGDQYMSLAITPSNSSNKLKIEIVFNGADVGYNWTVALFQDSTAGALAAVAMQGNNVNGTTHSKVCTFTHYMAAGTTSATTFKVRAGQTNAGTFYFNSLSGGRIFGGVLASSITIHEIKA